MWNLNAFFSQPKNNKKQAVWPHEIMPVSWNYITKPILNHMHAHTLQLYVMQHLWVLIAQRTMKIKRNEDAMKIRGQIQQLSKFNIFFHSHIRIYETASWCKTNTAHCARQCGKIRAQVCFHHLDRQFPIFFFLPQNLPFNVVTGCNQKREKIPILSY